MKNKLFLFLASAILLSSCNGLEDDRNRPIPANPRIAWLLSVEVDKLPPATVAYGCNITNSANTKQHYDFVRDQIKLPELLKIPGGQLLKENSLIIVTIVASDPNLNTATAYTIVPHYPQQKIDTVEKNGTVIYDTTLVCPQKIEHEENGIRYKLHLRYD